MCLKQVQGYNFKENLKGNYDRVNTDLGKNKYEEINKKREGVRKRKYEEINKKRGGVRKNKYEEINKKGEWKILKKLTKKKGESEWEKTPKKLTTKRG